MGYSLRFSFVLLMLILPDFVFSQTDELSSGTYTNSVESVASIKRPSTRYWIFNVGFLAFPKTADYNSGGNVAVGFGGGVLKYMDLFLEIRYSPVSRKKYLDINSNYTGGMNRFIFIPIGTKILMMSRESKFNGYLVAGIMPTFLFEDSRYEKMGSHYYHGHGDRIPSEASVGVLTCLGSGMTRKVRRNLRIFIELDRIGAFESSKFGLFNIKTGIHLAVQ